MLPQFCLPQTKKYPNRHNGPGNIPGAPILLPGKPGDSLVLESAGTSRTHSALDSSSSDI